VKGEYADMIFPGEETNGLSNAIVCARLNMRDCCKGRDGGLAFVLRGMKDGERRPG
jgi:hypothetical protein